MVFLNKIEVVIYLEQVVENEYRVKIKLSLLEQEIISLRENYKKLYKESEATRIELKEKKKLFYEKNNK